MAESSALQKRRSPRSGHARSVAWALAVTIGLATIVTLGAGEKVFHFVDSEIYINIARNLSEGRGDLATPVVGRSDGMPFTEHPPFWPWVAAGWLALFGDGAASTNLFPAAVLLVSALALGLGCWRWTGDRRAFFWASFAVIATSVSLKWRHETLLDHGLLLAATVVMLAVLRRDRRSDVVTGLLLGLGFLIGALSKGVFALAFLAVAAYRARSARRPVRLLAGCAVGVATLAGIWVAVDGPDFGTARAILALNVAPSIGMGPRTSVHDMVATALVATLPWSPLLVLGLTSARRWPGPVRCAYLLIAVSLAGFVFRGRMPTHYLLMTVPAVALISGYLLTRAPASLERRLRIAVIALVLLAVGVRVLAPVHVRSNRAPEVRRFLAETRRIVGPETDRLGLVDATSLDVWYLMTYGWNHYGFDIARVCPGGHSGGVYDVKQELYLLPCDRRPRPRYWIAPSDRKAGPRLLTVGPMSLYGPDSALLSGGRRPE